MRWFLVQRHRNSLCHPHRAPPTPCWRHCPAGPRSGSCPRCQPCSLSSTAGRPTGRSAGRLCWSPATTQLRVTGRHYLCDYTTSIFAMKVRFKLYWASHHLDCGGADVRVGGGGCHPGLLLHLAWLRPTIITPALFITNWLMFILSHVIWSEIISYSINCPFKTFSIVR